MFVLPYLWNMCVCIIPYSIGLLILFAGRYMVLNDVYSKIENKYRQCTTYYINMGKYLYNSIEHPCPFFDNLVVMHMTSLFIINLVLFDNVIRWLNDYTISFGPFSITSMLFLIGDCLIFKYVTSHIFPITIPSDQTNFITKWIKINFRIDVNYNMFNINALKFHAPVDIMNQINDSLKKVTESA